MYGIGARRRRSLGALGCGQYCQSLRQRGFEQEAEGQIRMCNDTNETWIDQLELRGNRKRYWERDHIENSVLKSSASSVHAVSSALIFTSQVSDALRNVTL